MRLYCLASISRISPPENYVPPIPYDEGADELAIRKGLQKHKYYSYAYPSLLEKLPSEYRLTEICIGWREFEEGPKSYEIEIYQTKSEIIGFPMLRGFASLTYLNNNENASFELCLATSKMLSTGKSMLPKFDLKIRGFCIKHTELIKGASPPGILTPEEESAYNQYAKQLSDFWAENSAISPDNYQVEAIQKLGPLKLPNQSTAKVLKQKLTDFEKAVDLLCNPETGSYKSMVLNVYNPITKKSKGSRINQECVCLLYLKESTWHAKQLRNLNDNDKYRDCTALRWENVPLNNNKINFSIFNFKNLQEIQFKKVFLGNSLEYWNRLAAKINFAEVKFISLHECEIKALDDKFFTQLSPKLQGLRLVDNDIKTISPKISHLTNLFWLDLNGNERLEDNGIPWKNLPSSIQRLELGNTNITKIPSEINKLTELNYLNVSSFSLNHISRESFQNRNCCEMNFAGGGLQLNEIDLKHINISKLTISNLRFVKFDFDLRHLTTLRLINNKLQSFNFLNLPDINYDHLTDLTISKNRLKKFSWKCCSKRLRKLDLSHNELEAISVAGEEIDFSKFKDLTEVSFESNIMRSVPEGFQNLPKLQKLNLSWNYFGYDGANLIEVLWKRLPKSLITLNLTHNKIDAVPCCLRDFKIQNLHVTYTNLHHICPFLHTNVQREGNYLVIDARYNQYHELSFIPSTIYPLPTSDIKPIVGKPIYPYNIPNYANFATTTILAEEKPLRDTSRTQYNNKAVYKFNSDGIKNIYACKCCAMCGESTEEPLFEQQMAMDSVLLIKNEKLIKAYQNSAPVYFEPGQWKSKIVSRLCVNCKKALKAKIDEAFEKFENAVNAGDDNNVRRKKKKISKDDICESSAQFQTFYNAASERHSWLTKSSTMDYTSSTAGPSSSTNHLPPINSFLSNPAQVFYHEPIVPYEPNPWHPAIQGHPSLPEDSTMDYEENPIIGFDNIAISNAPATENQNPPQIIVLLDQHGNQVCTWNVVTPSPQGYILPTLMSHEHYPYQEIFSNQNFLTSSNTNNDNDWVTVEDNDETSNGWNLKNL